MKIKIISDGHRTQVFTEDGRDISSHITGVNWRHTDASEPARAEIELGLIDFEGVADALVYVGGREVRRIEYADGDVAEYPVAVTREAVLRAFGGSKSQA